MIDKEQGAIKTTEEGSAEALLVAGKVPPTVKCATADCPNTFEKAGTNHKFCKECSAERRKTGNSIQARAESKVKTETKSEHRRLREQEEAEAFNCPDPVKEKEARAILRETWSRNANVINHAYIFGVETARELALTANTYYWRHGAALALEAKTANQNLPPIEISEEWDHRAEVLSLRELYCLWTFACTGKRLLAGISFETWLSDYRDHGRKELFWLSTDVLKIPFDEKVHREFTDNFYPRFDNVSYPENYQLTDVHRMITEISEVKDYLCLFPRGYLKSASASAFALQFLLNFPDAAVFTVSGTAPLALGFLRIQKGYLSKAEDADPSLFHLIYPEYTMHDLDIRGETPITLGARRFDQKDYSFRTTGVEACSSSVHSQLTIFDDAVQEAGTDLSRPKLKDLLDTLASNIPDAGTLKLYLGTRYHLQDYYGGLIELVNEDPTALRFICRGAVTPKIGFSHIPWDKLEFEQVDLLWPGKIGSSPEKTWADLKKKIKRNLNDFMCQQQNDPLNTDNPDTRICFDPDMVMKHVKDPSLFPKEGDRHLVVDVSYSTDNRADFGVIACANEALNDSNPGEQSLYFFHIDAQRRTNSNLALAIAEAVQRFSPIKKIWIEKVNGVELLIQEARRQAEMRGVRLPEVYAIKIDLTKNAKWNRIKNSEILMNADRIVISDKCESLALTLDQYCKYDGRPSSQRRKDDVPDTVSLLALHILHPVNESAKEAEARRKLEAEEESRAELQEQYEMIYGSGVHTSVSTGRTWRYSSDVSDKPQNEGRSIGVSRGAWGIPGLRTPNADRQSDPNRKTVSFGDIMKKQ